LPSKSEIFATRRTVAQERAPPVWYTIGQ
jgi:hypothetical protein